MSKVTKKSIENKEKVLEVLKTFPKGALAVDISDLTGIPVKAVRRILIGLRNNGKVYNNELSGKKNTFCWLFNTKPNPSIEKSTVLPISDFDKEHAEWINKQKPVYNPWGKSC